MANFVANDLADLCAFQTTLDGMSVSQVRARRCQFARISKLEKESEPLFGEPHSSRFIRNER